MKSGDLEISKKEFYFRKNQKKEMKSLLFFLLVSINFVFAQNQMLENYIKNCESFLMAGQIDSVKKYAVLAREKALNEGNSLVLAKAELFIGNAAMRTTPDSAYKLIKRSYDDFLSRNDTKYLTSSSNMLGNYYAQKGSKDEAIKYYLQAKEYAEKYYSVNETARYPRVMASFYLNIASTYIEISDFPNAINNTLMAIKIANQHNLKEIELVALVNMGNIQFGLRQDDLAEKYFRQALELALIQNNILRKGVIMNNLGNIYLRKVALKNDKKDILRKKYFVLAKENYTQALEIAIKLKDYPSVSQRLNNLSSLEITEENYQKSKEYLLEAIKYAEISKMKAAKMKALANLALNYVKTDEIILSIATANEAISLAKEVNDIEVLPKLYNTLEQAYTKQKDFAKALEFQQAKINSKDSLYKASTNAQIQELQTMYETEKKQEEIELLTAKNQINEAEIKQKNYLILAITLGILMLLGSFLSWNWQRNLKIKQQTAEMKQRLLRAQLNPHFLFNCLNSIQRLYVDGKTQKANDFIADFAQLMRDILEKTSRTMIPLYEEMDFIEAYLSLEKRRLGDKFDFEITLSDELRNSDFQVPSFIVQPLVENALLHGILPKNIRGKIEIIVSAMANECVSITVKDDGVGIFRSLGNVGKHTSKGMELIKSRLGKKGKMFIEEIKNLNQEILGTKIELKFYA